MATTILTTKAISDITTNAILQAKVKTAYIVIDIPPFIQQEASTPTIYTYYIIAISIFNSQMTMFTIEGILLNKNQDDMYKLYLRWLNTQFGTNAIDEEIDNIGNLYKINKLYEMRNIRIRNFRIFN